MDVSAIIVTHNSRRHLIPCLERLHRALEGFASEIWIVDNASQDGGPEEAHARFPGVALVRNEENLGFARANNQAIMKSSGRYLMFLNPDTRLHPDCVRVLAAFLKGNHRVGIVGPAVYDDEDFSSVQMSARRFPSYSTALFHRYSFITRVWKNNPWSRRYLQADLDREQPSKVDWVSACCMMARRDALTAIGLFDEGFWMFAEDVDLCKRAWQSGWEVAYEPRARAVHFIGASKGQVHPRVLMERHRSMWRYYWKHHRKGALFSAAVLAGIALRCTFHLTINALRKTQGEDLSRH